MLLRAHYEINGNNVYFMQSQLDAFFRYIHRNRSKMGKSIFLSLETLASYIKKMSKNEDPKKLMKAIKKEKYLIFRLWLENKLKEEIQKKHK